MKGAATIGLPLVAAPVFPHPANGTLLVATAVTAEYEAGRDVA